MPTPRRAPAAAKKVAVPDTAKQPQDHQAKSTGKEPLIATVRGRKWAIDPDVMDDFELLDDLNALDQRGDPTRMPSVLRRLMGDQWSDVMDLLRDEKTGRVTVEEGSTFVMELVTALNPNS